jgi:hypothetical protein
MIKIKELEFNDNMLSNHAADELEKNGVVIVNNFISNENCLNLKSLLDGSQLKNSNELTFVHLDDAKFFSNAVAQSKTAYDLVTSQNTFKISKKYLGENIRLKCHRAYSTKKNYYFPWHTDNKFDDMKNNRKGIVFIIYLVDTDNGATEFVLGSHKESSKFENNNFLDDFINLKFKDKIVKAKGKRGCAVISDTRVIHRGSFDKGKKINRYSFWFQIDSNTNEAERLLLNPEFLPKNISNELSEYLGFSKNFGLKVHPITTNVDKVIPYNERLKMFYKYLTLSLLIPFNWIRLKLPIKIKIYLKNILKRKSDWN